VTIQSFSLRVASLLATAVVVGVGLVAALLQVSSGAAKAATFSPYVDEKGNISVPAGYRSQWAHLGTWSVPEMMGGLSYHEVYTQPSSVEAYQKTGVFPDGAVLVVGLGPLSGHAGRPAKTGHAGLQDRVHSVPHPSQADRLGLHTRVS
jgi:hypothetical protein